MSLHSLVLDLWSALNFKAAMDPHTGTRLSKSWMGEEHRRRITAYHTLDAYLENCSREHLRDATDGEKASYREYGDPALLVARVVAGVLGETVTVEVEGADDDIPNAPELPDEPQEPAVGDERARRIYDLQLERWETAADEAIEEWEDAWRGQPALQARQGALREWADGELLEQKAWTCETDSIGLGDGVMVLGWDPESRRPRLSVYDPRTYFPVLDEAAFLRGYPTRVHLAWEEERLTDAGEVQVWLHRITYDLVDVPARRMPWGDTSTKTCLMTEAEWLLQDIDGRWVVDAVAPAKAVYKVDAFGEVRDRDLGIDFIPVIHDPGVPSGREHYGRSILARVLQIIDDLQANDSDTSAAAALAGTPMVGLSGKAAVPGEEFTVSPGAVFKLGEGGRMDVVDLSASVEALRHVGEDLLQRLSVNIQVPAGLLGRIDASEVPSGVALALSFSPFSQLVGVLRLVRVHKYRLLLKFVQRMYAAAREPGWEGETLPARLTFGAFLPEDQREMVEIVGRLLEAKAISRETALEWLAGVGLDVGDIPGEIARLNAADFQGAIALLDATGNEDAVADYLGVEPGDRPEPPPEIDLPGAPEL